MALKALEKLGAVAAFIPGVSTISGIIKAFVYYNKAQKKELNLGKEGKNETEETAQKTNSLGVSKLLNVNQEKKECYESLWKASIAEAIPGVNFIAAVYSATVLKKLSELREVNQSDAKRENFLFKKFGLKKTGSPERNKFISEGLTLLDGLKARNSPLSQSRQNEIKQVLAHNLFGAAFNESSNKNATEELKNQIKQYADSKGKEGGSLEGAGHVVAGYDEEIDENSSLEDTWRYLVSTISYFDEAKRITAKIQEERKKNVNLDLPLGKQPTDDPFGDLSPNKKNKKDGQFD